MLPEPVEGMAASLSGLIEEDSSCDTVDVNQAWW